MKFVSSTNKIEIRWQRFNCMEFAHIFVNNSFEYCSWPLLIYRSAGFWCSLLYLMCMMLDELRVLCEKYHVHPVCNVLFISMTTNRMKKVPLLRTENRLPMRINEESLGFFKCTDIFHSSLTTTHCFSTVF